MGVDRKLFVLLIFTFTGVTLTEAQPGGAGGLTEAARNDLQRSLLLTPADTALMNALTNNDVNNLALNRGFLKRHNTLYSREIETKEITDQENSGRCWIFAGLNVLRPAVIEKYRLESFEFSESYLSFWDLLEKSNFMLEYIIAHADLDLLDRDLDALISEGVGDGGYWQWFAELVEKYGLVPKEVFPESHASSNTWPMIMAINEAVFAAGSGIRQMAAGGADIEKLRAKKTECLKSVYRILVLNFSEPPREFVWRYRDRDGKLGAARTYTPREFFKQVVNRNLRNCVSLVNFPGYEYNRLYRCRDCRNVHDAPDPVVANVAIDVLVDAARQSIEDGEPLWFACDFGPEISRDLGIISSKIFDYRAIYASSRAQIDKETRVKYRLSTANHAMVFEGFDLQADRPVKWRVENSHGKEEGKEGFYALYDDWFRDYLYEICVDLKYLPAEIREIFSQEPVVLPLWDPITRALRIDD